MSINVGIIGAGEIAEKAHIPAYISHPDCNILAICGKNNHSKRADILSEKYNIKKEEDYKKLLNREDIELVSICTPTYTHKEIIEYAISRDKHILCEKPLATSLKDTLSILNKIKSYKNKFMVMFNNRYRDENLWLKRELDSEKVGKIEMIDIEWLRSKREIDKSWLFTKKKAGGGVLIDLGVHLIDLLLFLVGKKESYKVSTFSKRINSYENSDVEDLVISTIILDNIYITLKTGWSLKLNAPAKVNLKIYGDNGELSNSDYNGSSSNPYNKLIYDFIDVIKENRAVDLNIYKDTITLVNASYESIKKCKIVSGFF